MQKKFAPSVDTITVVVVVVPVVPDDVVLVA